MNKNLEQELYNKYPIVFKDHTKPMSETAMCWGMQCGDGWHGVIDELCEILDEIRRYTGLSTIATTVKEKYGTLRFYVRFENDRTWKTRLLNLLLHRKSRKFYDYDIWAKSIEYIIDQAEARSANTCEDCGDGGSLVTKGSWLSTLCEKCAKERDFEKEK